MERQQRLEGFLSKCECVLAVHLSVKFLDSLYYPAIRCNADAVRTTVFS